MRVKLFIDFWNFQLSWNDYHRQRGAAGVVRIPWKPLLYEVLVRNIDPNAVYAGTHVYASFDPQNPADRGRGASCRSWTPSPAIPSW